MSRTVCLVTARMASARCPGKALMELLPGEPLLAVLIKRMRTSTTVDEVALATSVNPENDAIADLGKSLGVRVFRGEEDDSPIRLARRFRELAGFADDEIDEIAKMAEEQRAQYLGAY